MILRNFSLSSNFNFVPFFGSVSILFASKSSKPISCLAPFLSTNVAIKPFKFNISPSTYSSFSGPLLIQMSFKFSRSKVLSSYIAVKVFVVTSSESLGILESHFTNFLPESFGSELSGNNFFNSS